MRKNVCGPGLLKVVRDFEGLPPKSGRAIRPIFKDEI